MEQSLSKVEEIGSVEEAPLEESDNRQFVTFYIDDEFFGFNMKEVQEIVWMPDTIFVPLTPPSFLGLANLRGSILPILDLRVILDREIKEITDTTRVVIINCGQPIGLLVDKVDRVIQVEQDKIEEVSDQKESSYAEFLSGVVKHPRDESKLIQILDGKKIVEREFVLEERKNLNSDLEFSKFRDFQDELEDKEDTFHQLVSFYLKDQEFAVEVFDIKEIVRFPEGIYEVPNTDPALMGIVSYRESMLPLINLGMILKFDSQYDIEQSGILVAMITHKSDVYSIGLVVDKVQEILKVSEEEWEAVPELLASQSNQNDIKAVCRLEGGRRIVSVISLNNMLNHPAFEAALSISQEHKESNMNEEYKDSSNEEEIQLVIFKLQDEEYGIFIEYIQEIILVPEEINIVPKTPDYMEGMINLRGSVLPVIDMRKRLGLPYIERQENQRILVLNTQGVKMGFIVDSVVEVLCVGKSDVEEVPKMSSEQASVLGRVINLKDQNRIILIINVEELLHKEELQEISNISKTSQEEED